MYLPFLFYKYFYITVISKALKHFASFYILCNFAEKFKQRSKYGRTIT